MSSEMPTSAAAIDAKYNHSDDSSSDFEQYSPNTSYSSKKLITRFGAAADQTLLFSMLENRQFSIQEAGTIAKAMKNRGYEFTAKQVFNRYYGLRQKQGFSKAAKKGASSAGVKRASAKRTAPRKPAAPRKSRVPDSSANKRKAASGAGSKATLNKTPKFMIVVDDSEGLDDENLEPEVEEQEQEDDIGQDGGKKQYGEEHFDRYKAGQFEAVGGGGQGDQGEERDYDPEDVFGDGEDEVEEQLRFEAGQIFGH